MLISKDPVKRNLTAFQPRFGIFERGYLSVIDSHPKNIPNRDDLDTLPRTQRESPE